MATITKQDSPVPVMVAGVRVEAHPRLVRLIRWLDDRKIAIHGACASQPGLCECGTPHVTFECGEEKLAELRNLCAGFNEIAPAEQAAAVLPAAAKPGCHVVTFTAPETLRLMDVYLAGLPK